MESVNSNSIDNVTTQENPEPVSDNSQGGGSIVSPPFDEYTFYLIDMILRIAIPCALSVYGIVTNIINIIVFYYQGFLSDSCTVCLTALAISDFVCCLLMFWGSVCRSLDYILDNAELSFKDFYGFSFIRPKSIFAQITCWLTAYIAFERFICVLVPFKAKMLLNPRRSLFVVVGIFVVTVAVYFPQYLSYFPKWVRQPDNSTKLVYVYTDLVSNQMRNVFLFANPVSLRILSMCLVVIFNITILWKLNVSMRFKEQATQVPGSSNRNTPTIATIATSSNPNSDREEGDSEIANRKTLDNNREKNCRSNRSKKEMRLHRMILVICAVFLACYTPDVILVCIFIVGSSMGSHNYHRYVLDTSFAVGGILEIINSSSSIIIYYRLSTKYKEQFLLRLRKQRPVGPAQQRHHVT